jgi:hypothetical protein
MPTQYVSESVKKFVDPNPNKKNRIRNTAVHINVECFFLNLYVQYTVQ